MLPALFIATMMLNAPADVIAAENREDLRVLVIDDSRVIRQVTRQNLIYVGFQGSNIVQVTPDDALETVSSESFDVVIFGTGGAPGELFRNLRAATNAKIIVSLLAGVFEFVSYYDAGADTIIAKPFNADILDPKLEAMGL